MKRNNLEEPRTNQTEKQKDEESEPKVQDRDRNWFFAK